MRLVVSIDLNGPYGGHGKRDDVAAVVLRTIENDTFAVTVNGHTEFWGVDEAALVDDDATQPLLTVGLDVPDEPLDWHGRNPHPQPRDLGGDLG